MVKVKVDTKIILDFGGVSHELTNEEAREIIRQLQKAVGEKSASLELIENMRKKDATRERDKVNDVPYEAPVFPLSPYHPQIWPSVPSYPKFTHYCEYPIITFGGQTYDGRSIE